MVGRLVSFWETLFSGAMLDSERVGFFSFFFLGGGGADRLDSDTVCNIMMIFSDIHTCQ